MEVVYQDRVILPRQKVLRAVKDTLEWKHKCVDAIIASTKGKDSQRRRSVTERKRNYDLLNNKIDITEGNISESLELSNELKKIDYKQFISLNSPSLKCMEIGFNGGHSAEIFLSSFKIFNSFVNSLKT